MTTRSGCIADIKKFSVHDGPGIRTTVFLKGCSLHCLWCHNPETISTKPEIGLIFAKCVLCGDCVCVCPEHAQKIENGIHVLDHARCSVCGKCTEECLHGALEFYGKQRTPEEVASIILEDRLFYETSHGGATVSGGEPLLQADFVSELFAILKKEKIHCAVDTCGNVPWSAFEKVLPLADIFLYDFKHADSTAHKNATGCGNELIQENLKKLDETGKDIEIRIPLIPGINDSNENMKSTGEILAKMHHITKVRLLPYHALARSKYASVGRTDTMPKKETPTPEAMEKSALILREAGVREVVHN